MFLDETSPIFVAILLELYINFIVILLVYPLPFFVVKDNYKCFYLSKFLIGCRKY